MQKKAGFLRLDDLTAIDESCRVGRRALVPGTVAKEIGSGVYALPENRTYPDYTLVYHLLSFESAGRLRLKVGLTGKEPMTRTVTDIWPSANWYEREAYEMF